MGFDPGLLESARREVLYAPYGMRGEMAARWSHILAVSPQHLRRLLTEQNPFRERRQTEPIRPEYYAWAHTIWQVKTRPPEEAGELSMEDAIASAVKQRLVPAEAAGAPVGTYNRIGREMGWTAREKRRNRIQALRPNEAHHFDASTSQFLHIAKRLGDGEYLLKLHRPAAGGYKNKPIPVDRLRPYYYAAADDHSGRLAGRCVAAVGENAADSMESLCEFWEEMGLPEELDCDEGMLKKCFASRDWVERLRVALPPHMPYEKEAHGKIERPWRTLWQKFEMVLYAECPDWKKFEITMGELNRRLKIYIEDKYNRLPHRFEKNLTKMQAWQRINLYGGVVRIPRGSLATVARRDTRTVGVDGKLEWEGGVYEVVGLHNAKVWVFEGVFDDRLVVQDTQTGQKYEVRDFHPLARNEFRAHAQTEREKMVRAGAALPLNGQGLYSEKAEANQKIASMPTRVKEEREISDPLNVTAYASMAEAWAEITAIAGPVTDREQRAQIEELVRAHGMDKAYAADLAQELRAAIEVERRAAAG